MVELSLPVGFVGAPLESGFFAEQSPTRDAVIDTAALGLEAKRGFQPTVMLVPELYDFSLDVTKYEGNLYNPPNLVESMDISLPQVLRAPSRTFSGTGTFGGGPETFEGDGFLAAAAIAGAIGILALVGGGIYLTYQLQKIGEFGAELLRPGMELGSAIVETIIPEPEE